MPNPFKDTLTFGDAVRITGPVAFNVMIKPAGSLCNLDCNYCYYLDKADIYLGREPRMSLEMLETVVREYIGANDAQEVTFNWHGGEPLVLGPDFYRKALEYQRKYAGEKIIHNTIQTNGTLLNAEWAALLGDNDFLVGISIDGPRDIHDRYRRDKGGRPTFDAVMRGLELLYRSGVRYNTMTTVNHASEGRGLEVYNFLKSVGSRFMQFMPVVEHVKYPPDKNGRPDRRARPHIVSPAEMGASIARWSVAPLPFGTFLTDIFDHWVRNDVGRVFVNQFDCALACRVGRTPGTCAYASTCGGNSVIEHNGDVYPCDHFVYPEYRLGNIADTPLRTMMTSAAQTKFGTDKRNSLPGGCIRCKWLLECNGECPKHRFNLTDNGETGLNALCEGYRKFYSHIEPYMAYMEAQLREEKPPANVMAWARARK